MNSKEMNIVLPEIKFVHPLKPLLPALIPEVICGMVHHLCIIFIPVMGVSLFLREIGKKEPLSGRTVLVMGMILVVMAVIGGLLYYGKKSCSRRIGATPLISVGGKVYGANVVLSEAIVVLTILAVGIYIGHYHILSGLFALIAGLVVMVVIPGIMDGCYSQKEADVQEEIESLKEFVQDTLEGMDEIRQYHQQSFRQQQMSDRSKHLVFLEKKLSNAKAEGASYRNLAVLLLTFGMMFLNMYLYEKGGMDFAGAVLSTIAMMGMLRPILY